MNISHKQSFTQANLGLGGNMGDPARAMATALQIIDSRDDCRVLKVSRLYRTPPWGKLDQDAFLNACAMLETSLTPEALLQTCLDIEKQMKRERIEQWGPRTLDIDVLTYGTGTYVSPKLVLPHPRMVDRGFVLMPLADYAPSFPIQGKPVSEWLKTADVEGIEVVETGQDWWRSRS